MIYELPKQFISYMRPGSILHLAGCDSAWVVQKVNYTTCTVDLLESPDGPSHQQWIIDNADLIAQGKIP